MRGAAGASARKDNDSFWEMAATPEGLIALLGDLKKKLQAAYPDCAPLRHQMKRIDMSVTLIGGMKPANT